MDKWTFLLSCVRDSWHRQGKPKRIIAAVSGGADSVALLHLLLDLAEAERLFLSAVHVDHGIREASSQDAAFTKSLCEAHQIPCKMMQVKIKGKGEGAAREARYTALIEAAMEMQASFIALAHHRRDQAETMLLHLMRGSGSAGLSGMAEMRVQKTEMGKAVHFWRPLLDVSPDDLRLCLTEKGIGWCEDETNASDLYLRNFLRHRILPLLENQSPGTEKALARAAQLIAQDHDCLQKQAASFLEQYARLSGPCRFICRAPLIALHPAIGSRAIRMALPVSLDQAQTTALLSLKAGESVNLPQGWKAIATQMRLHLLPSEKDFPTLGSIRVLPYCGSPGDGIRYQAMPKAIWEKTALSFRTPGDRIHPLGAPGEKLLSDYWVDKKVDRPFRDYLPLLRIGNRIIWSIGIGPSEEARVKEDTEMVLLAYVGQLPFEMQNDMNC